MRVIARPSRFVCTRCLRVHSKSYNAVTTRQARYISTSHTPQEEAKSENADQNAQSSPKKEQGAMSRRLSEMSEENVEMGGRSAARAIEEAGFSEDLKRQLEEKIKAANFKSKNAAAFAQVNMPSSADRRTKDIAAAKPWSGTETTEDATLRMLSDAHKPIRVAPKTPSVRGPAQVPRKVDTGRPKNQPGTGTRLANARDKTSMYSFMQDSGLSEEEREKFRQGMKARFQPGARAAPATIQGLASLANERIEDAISRGQFKNLPRGKKIERDHNASSPFINTTEYLMNKIIQKQDIVPPWIEKQQELVTTASRFRSRLRADWRRHVARIISSRGGGLEKQMKLAEEYAYAESIDNPPKKKVEKLNAVDDSGHLSQITLAGELKIQPPSPSSINDEEMKLENEIKIMEQTFNDDGTLKSKPDESITISTKQPLATPPPPPQPQRRPTVPPFRDPEWEATEGKYLAAAVGNLNALARSYNLMAPAIARKPYFDLGRELKACYADVAPQVADAIRERSIAPKLKGFEVSGHKAGGVLDRFSADQKGHIHDSTKPLYGFKEFWRDLFAGSKA